MKDVYTFHRDYDFENIGVSGAVTNSIECEGWTELADEFLDFLKGCGFQVYRADLAEHYTDIELGERD
jgi:hypothetical protein